jgi:hypothetical protein
MAVELQPGGKEALERIRAAYRYLGGFTSEYEVPIPPPNVIDHFDLDDAQRAEVFGRDVISSRIMGILAATFMKTRYLVELYLASWKSPNPFGLLLAARSQIELFAIARQLQRAIAVAKTAKAPLSASVLTTLDESLVKLFWGSKKLHPDWAKVDATNGMTLLQKDDGKAPYPECWTDYEHLSEYLHPNLRQNALLGREVPGKPDYSRLATDELVMVRAIAQSVEPMARAVSATIESLNQVDFPFGTPRLWRRGPASSKSDPR